MTSAGFGAVYGIQYKATKQVVYVGQTRCCPHKRYREHISSDKQAVGRAISMLGGEGFTLVLLEQVPAEKLNAAEKYWIKRYETIGPAGLNQNSGGYGNLVLRGSTRLKMVEASTGRVVSEITKRRLRDANLGKKASEETKSKMSASQRGRVFSEEHRRKVSEATTLRNTGSKPSEETRTKMSASHMGNTHSAETKLKMSEARKGKPHSAEHSLRIAEGLRAAWAKKKALKKEADGANINF